MMDYIVSLDHRLFLKINGEWTNAWLDGFFPVFTDLHKLFWFKFILVPLAIVTSIFIARKKAALAICALILSIFLSEIIAYRVIKPLAHRERPPVVMGDRAHIRVKSYSGYSFPSNHASNNFAAAVLLSFLIPQASLLFYVIAASVAYSRVYVGVHFPLDVIGGGIVGVFCGIIAIYFYKWVDNITTKKIRIKE